MDRDNSKVALSDMKHAALFIAMNEGSGPDTKDLATTITEHLQEAGCKVTWFTIPKGKLIAEACEPMVEQAAATQGIVVAAGGDGTVNALAQLCYKHKVTLAVIPLGTFNYFARAIDIPTDLKKALDTVIHGTMRVVSAGFVQDRLFLNNASFGLYPELIKQREKATARFGRKRIVGAVSALHSLFQPQKMYAIDLITENGSEHHRTNMVFVGNNTLQLENLGLEVGECTKANRLAVVILKSLNRLETARLIWRGIVRNLKFESKLQQFCTDNFKVETQQPTVDMVIDGEIVQCRSPIEFRIEADAIRVIVPEADAS